MIVSVSSIAGLRPSVLSGSAYSASKAGLGMLSACINLEEGPRGIRSCVISPGDINTDLLDRRPDPPPPVERVRVTFASDSAVYAPFFIALERCYPTAAGLEPEPLLRPDPAVRGQSQHRLGRPLRETPVEAGGARVGLQVDGQRLPGDQRELGATSPLAHGLRVRAGRSDPHHDDREHRRPLPAVYNAYTRVPRRDAAVEAIEMLLRPLFYAAFLIDDYLADHDFFGARSIIIASASSKTAVGLAHLLSRARTHEVVGLTAAANRAFVARLVNDYRRLVQGVEAPVLFSWAHLNREALIRGRRVAAGEPETMRIEVRAPDPSCNPYLAFAVMLGAGLDGVAGAAPVPGAHCGSVKITPGVIAFKLRGCSDLRL